MPMILTMSMTINVITITFDVIIAVKVVLLSSLTVKEILMKTYSQEYDQAYIVST